MNKYHINYHKVRHGDEIKEKLETNDYWKIKDAERVLNESEIRYQEGK